MCSASSAVRGAWCVACGRRVRNTCSQYALCVLYAIKYYSTREIISHTITEWYQLSSECAPDSFTICTAHSTRTTRHVCFPPTFVHHGYVRVDCLRVSSAYSIFIILLWCYEVIFVLCNHFNCIDDQYKLRALFCIAGSKSAEASWHAASRFHKDLGSCVWVQSFANWLA